MNKLDTFFRVYFVTLLVILGWSMAIKLQPLATGAEELTRWDFFSISNINSTLVLFVGISLWFGNIFYNRQQTIRGKALAIGLTALMAGGITYLVGGYYIPFNVDVQ